MIYYWKHEQYQGFDCYTPYYQVNALIHRKSFFEWEWKSREVEPSRLYMDHRVIGGISAKTHTKSSCFFPEKYPVLHGVLSYICGIA